MIGDLAAAADPTAAPYPQLAPVAMQQARHVARTHLRRRGAGGTPSRSATSTRARMATIGRRSAVAELPLGIRFAGTLGWLSWLGLHLLFLVGFRNRVVVLVNWAWNYVKWDRGNRVIVRDTARHTPRLARFDRKLRSVNGGHVVSLDLRTRTDDDIRSVTTPSFFE